MTVERSRILIRCVSLCAALGWVPAAAQGWDCELAGAGNEPARYITHFQKRDGELIDLHWPASIGYRILVETRDMLVAVHAYARPPSFRQEAGATAVVVILDKRSGGLRQSTIASGETGDSVAFGNCEERN